MVAFGFIYVYQLLTNTQKDIVKIIAYFLHLISLAQKQQYDHQQPLQAEHYLKVKASVQQLIDVIFQVNTLQYLIRLAGVFLELQQRANEPAYACGGDALPNKIIMQMKMQLSLDTSANSPIRRPLNSKDSNPPCNATSTYCSWVGSSQTESQMMSHSVIREVMQASRAKTILHEIHRIDEGTALYRVPKGEENWPHMQDSIPSRNLMYKSACYSTIKHIQERMKPSLGRGRPSSATNKQDTHNKKIALSGLITYKFNSVTAKKSLGLNLINHEERMIQDKQQANRRLNCKHQRESRILAKGSLQRYKKKLREEEGMVLGDNCSTDAYLEGIRLQKQQNQLIYGERAKKILCVKEYMQRELVDYQVARHAIEAIQQKQPPRAKPIPPKRKVDSDETVLMKRRVPHQRRAVNVHSFHFIE